MMESLRRLFVHLQWADQRALDALRRQQTPSPRALEIFAHVLAAEHVWLSRVRETTPRLPVWPALDLPQCEALAAELRDQFDALLASLDDENVDRTVHYRNSAGDEFDSRISDILLHVALHGAYHRGQVALLVRDAGDEPVPTDYIALARGAAAATRRP